MQNNAQPVNQDMTKLLGSMLFTATLKVQALRMLPKVEHHLEQELGLQQLGSGLPLEWVRPQQEQAQASEPLQHDQHLRLLGTQVIHKEHFNDHASGQAFSSDPSYKQGAAFGAMLSSRLHATYASIHAGDLDPLFDPWGLG